MSLEQIKGLMESKTVIFINPLSKKRMQLTLDKLNEADKYEVVEIFHGAAACTKGIYSLLQVPEIIEKESHTVYHLIPITKNIV